MIPYNPTPTGHFERRWLALKIDPACQTYPHVDIEQGYLEGRASNRVRITDGKTAELTRMVGKGRARHVVRLAEADLAAARFLMDSTLDRSNKRRHMRDGWFVDYHHPPLGNVVTVQVRRPLVEQLEGIVLPPWVEEAIEITDHISDRQMAIIAYDLQGESLDRPFEKMLARDVPRIPITGAAGCGKTTAIETLSAEYPNVLQCVPETATIVIHQVKSRPPIGYRLGTKRYQREIYRVQCSFESAAGLQALEDGCVALLLDRGTIDSAGYMSGGLPDLERTFRTTVAEEYERYHGLLFMDPAPRHIYEKIKTDPTARGYNPARYESYDEMVALNGRLYEAWKAHPNFRHIKGDSWEEKMDNCRTAFAELLASAKR